jgi:hypothetical protein
MSEPIGITIEIGGDLPANRIEGFLEALRSECYDVVGPSTENELRNKTGRNQTIKINATANFGNCDDLMIFCRKNKLGYIHHCEAKYEYEAEITYWVPGMKKAKSLRADQGGTALINIEYVKPVTDFLFKYLNEGPTVFPLHINEDSLKSIAEKCLKATTQKQILGVFERKFNELLPGRPRLDPFNIVEESNVNSRTISKSKSGIKKST